MIGITEELPGRWTGFTTTANAVPPDETYVPISQFTRSRRETCRRTLRYSVWHRGFGHDGCGFVSFKYIRDYANDAICIERKESKK